ncbi:transcriptional regulator with XRE-family HTH domain [Desulfomicrobium macestii]|uniref:Transcriptional regulator with XRE-family HTH domain n=1 Tax=Desulfomicrobium macestii TaxID=90731 RepID=A0ABR9H7N9_9BACT|nr:helix-turn-helix transcriptional regulator [Desulfomicrobium macestii]MBE1426730.1 transcriptional regulator with XRE-family HTH domain [Desulfomicrobium macestii]
MKKSFSMTEVLSMKVGKNLKSARLRRELSIQKLAEISELSPTTIEKIEKGDPETPIKNIIDILYAMQIERQILQIANPMKDSYKNHLSEDNFKNNYNNIIQDDKKFDF